MFRIAGSIIAILLVMVPPLAQAATYFGHVESLRRRGSGLSFECRVPLNTGDHLHRIAIDQQTQSLAVRLHDGVEIKGIATATRVPQASETYYYLTNGFVPYHYRFTVTVKDGGTAASFQMVEGARTIECLP